MTRLATTPAILGILVGGMLAAGLAAGCGSNQVAIGSQNVDAAAGRGGVAGASGGSATGGVVGSAVSPKPAELWEPVVLRQMAESRELELAAARQVAERSRVAGRKQAAEPLQLAERTRAAEPVGLAQDARPAGRFVAVSASVPRRGSA